MRTTSRWPCSTRRRISASTRRARPAARARRARAGSTQKVHEKEQPSCTFTNARTRSSRASAWTQPIAPTSPATNGRRLLAAPGDDDDVLRQAGERVRRRGSRRSRSRRRGGACARPATAAWRDLRSASWVTQHVLTTATSAPSARSAWPSASSRSRTACASVCETLQPRKPTEKRRHRQPDSYCVRTCRSAAQPSASRRSHAGASRAAAGSSVSR